MKITADANILFSALLKESLTRKLWFNPELVLFAPTFLVIEFGEYRKELAKKFYGSSADFSLLCEKIFSQVKFVQDEELIAFLPAASTLTSDSKDWIYLACALKENTVIWSNDKEMKKQLRITVKTTTELLQEMGML